MTKLFQFILIKLLSVSVMLTWVSMINAQEKNYNISFEARNAAIEAYNKGCKLVDSDKTNEGIMYLTKSIRIDSTLFKTYGTLFKASMISENYTDSLLNYFFIAKRIFDADDNICYYVAEIYRARKQFRNAILEYTNAIDFSKSDGAKSSNYPYYFSGRAFCYTQKNSFALAVNDYSVCLQLKPRDPVMLVNRGVCYQKLKEDAKAVADWEMAAKLGHPTAKEYLKRHERK
jgi:tetratricopeptide (TPR) repeat protein